MSLESPEPPNTPPPQDIPPATTDTVPFDTGFNAGSSADPVEVFVSLPARHSETCEPNLAATSQKIRELEGLKTEAADKLAIAQSVQKKGTAAFAEVKGLRMEGRNLGDVRRIDGVWQDSDGRPLSQDESGALDIYTQQHTDAVAHDAKETLNAREIELHSLRENAHEEAGGWLSSQENKTPRIVDNKVSAVKNDVVSEARTGRESEGGFLNPRQESVLDAQGEQVPAPSETALGDSIGTPERPTKEKILNPYEARPWNPEQHFFISSPRELRPDLHREAQKEIKETFARVADQQLEGSRELSPEISRFSNSAERWHEERFQRLGIVEKPAWSDRIGQKDFLPDVSNLTNPEGAEGHSGFGVITLKDYRGEQYEGASPEQLASSPEFLPMSVPAEILGGLTPEAAATHLRNFLQAKTLVHEKYHQTRPKEIVIESIGTPQGIHIEDARFADWPQALEEGMAMRMEQEAEDAIAREFPEGADLEKRLLQHVLENHPQLSSANEQVQNMFRIKDFDGKSVVYGAKKILFFKLIRKFLIPDFGRRFRKNV